MAIRLMWRIIAPRHPRGWLDLHPVVDDNGSTAWLHCHGMERWNLPNIEFVDVPLDLLGPAHGILMAITGYMKLEKPIREDENVGGFLNSPDQLVWHQATLRRPPDPQPGYENTLRVVDIGEPAAARFPRRLFAAHLISMAENEKSAKRQEWLFRRATEIYPGGFDLPPDDYSQGPHNPNNYFAWWGLGSALVEQGKLEEGFDALRQAIARWPFAAQQLADEIRKNLREANVPPDTAPVSRFWCSIDVSDVRAEVLEMKQPSTNSKT